MDETEQFLVAHILINNWLKFNLRNTYPKRIVKDNKNGIEKFKVISFKMNTKNEIIENDITHSLMVSDKIGTWLSVSRI